MIMPVINLVKGDAEGWWAPLVLLLMVGILHYLKGP